MDEAGAFCKWAKLAHEEKRVHACDYIKHDGLPAEVDIRIALETMGKMVEDNPDTKCFIVGMHTEYYDLSHVFHFWAYRETSHAIANLVLGGFMPADGHLLVDGYPNTWELFPPIGPVRNVIPVRQLEEWHGWNQ